MAAVSNLNPAFSMANILQLQSMDVRAAPRYLELLATPTTLEREIEVSGLGAGPTEQFVNMLRAGHPAHTKRIMGALGLQVQCLQVEIVGFRAGLPRHRGFPQELQLQ